MDVVVMPVEQLRTLLVEACSIALRHNSQPAQTASADTEPYGDFSWLCNTCPGIPASTLRIKSAAGAIPGVVKFGKRVLYEKSVVLNWLRSQTSQPVEKGVIEQQAEDQLNRQLSKRGGVRA